MIPARCTAAVAAAAALALLATPGASHAQASPSAAPRARFPLTPRAGWAPAAAQPAAPPPEPTAPPPAWGAVTAEPRREQVLPAVYITPREPPRPRIEVEPAGDAAANAPVAPIPHTPRNRLGRIVLETVGGAVLGAGVAALGGVIGNALAGPCAATTPAGGACAAVLVGGGIGAVLGVTFGVTGTGYLFDGNGALGIASLGALVGGGAGTGLILLMQPSTGSVVLAFALTLLGAVVGYEISSADSRVDAEHEQRANRHARAAAAAARPTAWLRRGGALAF